MTTSNDPDAIRRQIEATQRELSYDVDALNEKVNPARVVDRRVTAAKGRITSVKEKVMGSAQNARSSVMGTAHDTRSTTQYHAQNAAGTVQDAGLPRRRVDLELLHSARTVTQGGPVRRLAASLRAGRGTGSFLSRRRGRGR